MLGVVRLMSKSVRQARPIGPLDASNRRRMAFMHMEGAAQTTATAA